MAANAGQTAAHLGYFAAFMRAWGQADAATRTNVYEATTAYQSGTLSADQEVREVSTELSIPIPQGY